MSAQVFKDIFKYMAVWMIVLFLFTFIFIILGLQACEGAQCEDDHDDYKLIHPFTQIFFQTLRNGVGDLNAPIYNLYSDIANPALKLPNWRAKVLADTGMTPNTIQLYAYAIWGFWFLNCLINTILFLNILIAEVTNTY